MKSVDIANLFILRHGDKLHLTNLSLNKLVYYAQVEALKANPQAPLFADDIEAWDYGPVEPAVYHAFKGYGDAQITAPCSALLNENEDLGFAIGFVDLVAENYGSLSAFDLVNLSHRPGGAWRMKYTGARGVPITLEDILSSSDYRESPDSSTTFEAALQNVQDTWPNALRMLETS